VGCLCDAATGRIAIYYGAADTFTALCFCSAAGVVEFIKENPLKRRAQGLRPSALLPTVWVGCTFGAVKKPHVLLIFRTRFEESMAMLKGSRISSAPHHVWTAFHDDQAVSEDDPQWIRRKKWQGVISRHTTPQLVAACAELGIPLVDLNDVEPYPGVPKIRPDNVSIGHLGAEHFIERGYQKFGFCGFANNLWSRERRDGFVEAVRLAGRECSVFDVDYPGDLDPVLG
jgi:hypothetical protein